jgi:hypothetical protein
VAALTAKSEDSSEELIGKSLYRMLLNEAETGNPISQWLNKVISLMIRVIVKKQHEFGVQFQQLLSGNLARNRHAIVEQLNLAVGFIDQMIYVVVRKNVCLIID